MSKKSDSLTDELSQVRRAHLKLEAELKARDEFFSAVAHELRNPLNAIHLTLEGLLRASRGTTRLSPDQTLARIDRAASQVTRLSRLVDDMLDVSRISSGRLVLQFEEFDAAATLAEVVARQKDSGPASISLLMPASLVIRSDRARFALVTSNLLSNAILYGNNRPIEVRLDAAESTLCLTVTDHGAGIADDDQERIFERFVKLGKETPNVRFGIGLWVAREVVRAMHGEIRVSSKLGEGSTFLVELPTLELAKMAEPAG